MKAAKKNSDNRQARSNATKSALMRAAEHLIAKHGMETVSYTHLTLPTIVGV